MIDKKFYSHLWFLILYVPFVFIIKEFLPENIARENGPIDIISYRSLFLLSIIKKIYITNR